MKPSDDHLRISRMSDTGYGSPLFLRACAIVAAYADIADRELSAVRAILLRVRAGSPLLIWYRCRLPALRIRLTSSAPGGMIAEHLAIRERGRWKYRRAQGVLLLPAEFSEYLRGRHRQAVRTNVRHAHAAGLTAERHVVAQWRPGPDDFRAPYITPGPIERWDLVDSDGVIVAQAILSVDEEVALLQGLVSHVAYGRWLLHTAIVERLCGSCSVLLINSEDAYVMSTGVQHFQRLLGYEIMRLRLSRSSRAFAKRATFGLGDPVVAEASADV